jgi:hypothetical protein
MHFAEFGKTDVIKALENVAENVAVGVIAEYCLPEKWRVTS